MMIASNLRLARGVLGLKQDEIATQSGIPKSTYQKYEMGLRAPGSDAIAGFVRLGINANWLLTGEGPMLLKDLAPKPAPPLRINVEALAATLDAMRKTAKPGETPEATCHKAARFYAMLVEEELITEDGVGTGILKAAG